MLCISLCPLLIALQKQKKPDPVFGRVYFS
nr:MAG TPA: hypothetical protein [Caudoviricetes sp.]